MDRLPSTDFRKTYARLRNPTEVTVLDHVVGTWYPAGTGIETDEGRYDRFNARLTAGFGHSSPALKPGKRK